MNIKDLVTLPPTYEVREWQIWSIKSAILGSEKMDELAANLGIALPEMIFGENALAIRHKTTGWTLSFCALEALGTVDKTGDGPDQVLVSYSKEWLVKNMKRHGNSPDVRGIVKNFDWTYTTNYSGTTHMHNDWTHNSTLEIPYDRLKQPDPILFYNEVPFFEDELGDNGISNLTAKIRVMPERLYILQRFFLRVDNVIFRIRDTRVYIDFGDDLVIHEYSVRQDTYEQVCKKIPGGTHDVGQYLRDSNWISSVLPQVQVTRKSVRLSP